MIIYFYSLVPLLFLPTDSSSIRDRNFKNDLVPLFGSRLDSSKKDANSLKIVSNEPFIIQLQMPNSEESTKRGGKEKDVKRKRPTKKRISKLKPLRKRHRQRRDLQPSKADPDRERKSGRPEMAQTGKLSDHQSENATKNAMSRTDILKALSAYTKKREAKKDKKDVRNFNPDEEKGTETAKYVSDKTPEVQRLSSSPVVKMVYPSAPKSDKHLHKYSYKDLMSDRERLEKKIKYIRNLMNLSAVDDAVRVRRRSESDRTANKIAKMFLTLSAVNGLHDKLRSKCDDDEDDEDNYEDGYGFLEKESQENPSKRSFSSNEERYKVKKWIEHMKNKRSSSKTCPCMAKEREDESDIFPLEQKLPKNYFLLQKGGGSEESSETYGDLSRFHREKSNRNNHSKRRNHKAREDQESKLKALTGKGKKLELPLDDLELYRMKAKQILQNAEEILDKIKEEEEKRLTTPNLLMNQLKELTSRIQTDPRNNENDLIRKLQKTLGLGSASKSSDGTDGSGFLDNVKSFILDPYEKAKALTDESTKKLSSYLLRNLGELQEPAEIREGVDDKDDKGMLEKYFGQIPSKEDKPHSVSLAKENVDDFQANGAETGQNWTDTVSSVSNSGDESKKIEDWSNHQDDQFKKRMEEIMKEQERKLNGYEGSHESEESSKEASAKVGNKKEEHGESEIVELGETLKEDETAAPLQQKKDEKISNPDSGENYKTEKADESETKRDSTSKESDYVSEREVSKEAMEKEKTKRPKDEVEQDLLTELIRELDEKEESAESEVASDHKELGFKEGDKKANSANEESDAVELVHEKSKDEEEIPEVVAAATPKEEIGVSNADPENGSHSDDVIVEESDEKIEAKKPEQSKEDKSDEETMLEEQKEAEADPQINSADHEENVSLEVSEMNKGAELLKEADHSTQKQNIQEEAEPQSAEESSALLKEATPEESLEKVKSNEEKEEAEAVKDEKEDTLQLETPAEGHKQEEKEAGEENKGEETSDEDQLSKTLVKDDEDQDGLSGATKEHFDESKKEVSDDQEEQNLSDESPLGSATSKEFIKETSLTQQSDEDGDEVSQKNEKLREEVSDKDKMGNKLKEANEEVQEFSGEEETAPLKATKNNPSNERDVEVNNDDRTVASEEKVSEALENTESSNEEPLKSALEPGKQDDEFNRMAVDDKDTEIQDVEGEIFDKLRSEKPSSDINDGDSKTSKEKEGNEVVLETQKENFDQGEEVSLEAMGPSEERDRATQNSDNSDTVLRKENSEERLGNEKEDEDTLSKAPDGQDQENIKDESEESPSENLGKVNTQDEKDATTDGTLKAALEDKDRGNTDEDDKIESSLNLEESDEKLKMTEGSLESDAVGKPKEMEEDFNDRALENEDTAEEISLKATNNAEDGEVPLQATLNDKDHEDDEVPLKSAKDEDKQEKDENNADDTLMKSSSKDDQLSLEEADETPLKSKLTDQVGKEAEENSDKSEGISDDIPLGITSNKDNEESLEDVMETPLEETRNKDEESFESETPLRAVKVENELNDEERGNSNKSGKKAPEADRVTGDDSTEGTVRAKNPEEAYRESGALDEDNPLRANFEDFNNNIQDDDETLRASHDLNHPESLKDDSEESLREANIPDDLNNQIDGQNEDESPLRSVNAFDEMHEDPEQGYENLRKESPSVEDQIVSAEDESVAETDPIHKTKFKNGPKEEITPENLRELHPRKNPLKTNTLKVPKSIGKIMRDLEGPEKDDITTLENLNPEKIDHIIDKIDEVEQQNKVTDDVDCRKECACAEDINMKSRNIGRYEIVKDFLQWMKDLQLNRVLSDD